MSLEFHRTVHAEFTLSLSPYMNPCKAHGGGEWGGGGQATVRLLPFSLSPSQLCGEWLRIYFQETGANTSRPWEPSVPTWSVCHHPKLYSWEDVELFPDQI